jgi:hypothetical protein
MGRVRTVHRRLGISVACFLFVQAIAGMLMSIGRLASADTSPTYNILYSIHANWGSLGSVYRVVLGLATAIQGVLGMMILLSFRKKKDRPVPPPRQPLPQAATAGRALSFAVDIRPLFRSYDIESMKTYGIDLSSYEDVKDHAQGIYSRLSGKEMPCDRPWSESHLQQFKDWMENGMEP